MALFHDIVRVYYYSRIRKTTRHDVVRYDPLRLKLPLVDDQSLVVNVNVEE